MYQQRRPPPPTGRVGGRRPWLADVAAASGARGAERGGAVYAVVDDLDDGSAVLVVAPWPELDAHGRLTFGGPDRRRTLAVPAERLERWAEAARRSAGQEAPDRPLRVGDAFLAAAGGDDPSRDGEPLELLRDVTREAREQAKLAFFAAVAPRVDDEYAQEVGLVPVDGPEDDEPPAGPPGAAPGPTASPAV